jgi:hypothetical protein
LGVLTEEPKWGAFEDAKQTAISEYSRPGCYTFLCYFTEGDGNGDARIFWHKKGEKKGSREPHLIWVRKRLDMMIDEGAFSYKNGEFKPKYGVFGTEYVESGSKYGEFRLAIFDEGAEITESSIAEAREVTEEEIEVIRAIERERRDALEKNFPIGQR